MPIETPAPVLPTPTAAESAAIVAVIAEVPRAWIARPPPTIWRLLESTNAFVRARTVLKATAPAPLTATPVLAIPTETDAAAATASIVERATSKDVPFHVRM